MGNTKCHRLDINIEIDKSLGILGLSQEAYANEIFQSFI